MKTPVISCKSSDARAKGIQADKCTRYSSCVGVKLPGKSPNCSSRGKKAHPARGTGSITASQLDVATSTALKSAGVLSSWNQSLCARRTDWSLLLGDVLPVGQRAAHRGVLHHPCLETTHLLSGRLFYFPKRGIGMCQAPLFHHAENLFTQGSPFIVDCFFHLVLHSVMALVYQLFSLLAIPSQKLDAHPMINRPGRRVNACARKDLRPSGEVGHRRLE